MPIQLGAQLYTLRDYLRTPEDIRKTLTQVAGIGYGYIQCSGFAFEAAWLRALCDELSLRIMLTHTDPTRIVNDTQTVIAEHKILGCPYIGLGSLPGEYRSPDRVRQFLRDYSPAMEAFHGAGLKFQYHNHSFEFERVGGETLFDVLVGESDPALLGITLDVYWAQHAGMDVRALIHSLRGRVDVCHYKDMAIVGGRQRFAAIGNGNMNWPGIIAAFEDVGTRYAFVEQDECYGVDPVEELAASWRYLN